MKEANDEPYSIVLGIAQDAGIPQPGCTRSCCQALWKQKDKYLWASCLGIVEPATNSLWLLDITPHFPMQMGLLHQSLSCSSQQIELDGVMLTHAHMGHYTGLIFLGKEAMNTQKLPVRVLPRMQHFLENNEPWKTLIQNENIDLVPQQLHRWESLNARIACKAIPAEHRSEFSETAGFIIKGPSRSLLFLPDSDPWKEDFPIEQYIREVDRAYIDGTFFTKEELKGRDFDEVPHPCVKESVNRFKALPIEERMKIHFIHFNHTNPLVRLESNERKWLLEQGFRLAEQGESFVL